MYNKKIDIEYKELGDFGSAKISGKSKDKLKIEIETRSGKKYIFNTNKNDICSIKLPGKKINMEEK